MGTVVAIEHVTLDGVMQAPGRAGEDRRGGFPHGGWAQAHNDPTMQQEMGKRMGPSWALLAGRRTYQDFAAFWPHQPEPNPFGGALTRIRKYVVSTTLTEPLPWENSVLLAGDAADSVAALKRQVDDNLIVFGSGELVRTLTRHRVVDEYLLFVHPLVLGSGRRLFPDGEPPATLELVDAGTTPSGVLVAAYRPAG